MLNLATSDIVGAALTLSYMMFKALDHYRTDIEEVATAMVEHCRWILVVFRYQYQSTILAVICLTYDRYISINSFVEYETRITWKKVWVMVSLSWVIPLINCLIIAFLHSRDQPPGIRNENNFCSFPSHLDTRWWMMTDIIFVFMLLCLVFLNFKVLLTYIKLKQRHYKILKRNTANKNSKIEYKRRIEIAFLGKEFHIASIPVKNEEIFCVSPIDFHQDNKVDDIIRRRLSRLLRLMGLIKSSSYVVVILFLFIFCYLPGYFVYFYDILYDQLDYLHDHTSHICGDFNSSLAMISSLVDVS